MRAIFEAAKNLKSPIIIGTSEGESNYLGLCQTAALVGVFRAESGVPAALNLDHGKSFDYIKKAIVAGYDMVHFDGSKLSLEENIEITKKVTDFAHKKNILVEGEVGSIEGASEILEEETEISEEELTSVDEAERFVLSTGVDSLAVSVGTFHGMLAHKENPHINLQRLTALKDRLGDRVFLVLHGGSGTPEDDIRIAIEKGIVKININTELRLAFTSALKKILNEDETEVAPYKYMPKVVNAVLDIAEAKIKLFNSVNNIR